MKTLSQLWSGNKRIIITLWGAAFLGVLLRVIYARSLPITNDEGAYLYDSLQVTWGLTPYQDFLTKGPFLIYTLALGTKIFGASLWVGRGLAILSSFLTGLLIFLLARKIFSGMFSERAVLFSALLFFIFPTVAYYTSYTHLQVFQIICVTLSFLILLKAPESLSSQKKVSWKKFFLHGFLLGIAFFVRKTSAGLLLVTFSTIFLLFKYPLLRQKINAFLFSLVGFVITFLTVFIPAYYYLPKSKALDVVGAEVLKQATSQKAALGLSGIPSFLVGLLSEFLSEVPSLIEDGKLLTFLALIFIIYLVVNSKKNRLVWFPLIWFLTLGLVYLVWIKFRTPYFTEFLPPLALMGGASLEFLWRKASSVKSVELKPIFVLLAPLFLTSFSQTYKNPYTGSIPPNVAREAASFLKENTLEGEEVLTAAVVIPYLSGNRIPYDLSHSTWYGATNIPQELLLSYFPPFKEFAVYVKLNKIKYIVLEANTESSYFKHHPEFEKYVFTNYRQVKTHPTLTGPLRILEFVDK